MAKAPMKPAAKTAAKPAAKTAPAKKGGLPPALVAYEKKKKGGK
jgi:hypothetical protein